MFKRMSVGQSRMFGMNMALRDTAKDSARNIKNSISAGKTQSAAPAPKRGFFKRNK